MKVIYRETFCKAVKFANKLKDRVILNLCDQTFPFPPFAGRDENVPNSRTMTLFRFFKIA